MVMIFMDAMNEERNCKVYRTGLEKIKGRIEYYKNEPLPTHIIDMIVWSIKHGYSGGGDETADYEASDRSLMVCGDDYKKVIMDRSKEGWINKITDIKVYSINQKVVASLDSITNGKVERTIQEDVKWK